MLGYPPTWVNDDPSGGNDVLRLWAAFRGAGAGQDESDSDPDPDHEDGGW